MPVDAEKIELQKCYLGFSKFLKNKIWRFFHHFFLFLQNIPQISNLKTEYVY